MCNEALEDSRLYALIGESARALPDAAFATLELTLAKQERGTRKASASDVRKICHGATLRNIQALGEHQREALGTILEILHAAQQERGQEVDTPLLDERLLEGLIVAGRLVIGPTQTAGH